uniref:Uncharacterized protein n=1 Tax=Timema tahoe TaxID=61484 RepID=A0A7R9FMW3_9NEOP|nr:unnamed protein product [Timema tahoe]
MTGTLKFLLNFVQAVLKQSEDHGLPLKALLLIYNTAFHPQKSDLDVGYIKAAFLHPNVTALIQPMDQGLQKEGDNDSVESNKDAPEADVILHAKEVMALGKGLLYVKQHSKATLIEVMFMKHSSVRKQITIKLNNLEEKEKFKEEPERHLTMGRCRCHLDGFFFLTPHLTIRLYYAHTYSGALTCGGRSSWSRAPPGEHEG